MPGVIIKLPKLIPKKFDDKLPKEEDFKLNIEHKEDDILILDEPAIDNGAGTSIIDEIYGIFITILNLSFWNQGCWM